MWMNRLRLSNNEIITVKMDVITRKHKHPHEKKKNAQTLNSVIFHLT